MKKLLLVFLILLVTGVAFGASSTSSTRADCTYQNGFCDPRIYGGAADTMKQTITHVAGTDTQTLTITAGYVEATVTASSSLAITMTETGAFENDRVVIVNLGTGSLVLTDQSGILNVASTSMTLGTEDAISLVYTGTIWVETGRSDN